MRFAPGRTLLRRSWRGGRITFLNVTRVIADDDRGLRLWLPAGAPWWRIVAPDGRTHHDAPISDLGPDATLDERVWQGTNMLMWIPPTGSYGVWWSFAADTGAFTGWYVNLEEPNARWDDGDAAGVDTADHALDLLVDPDRSWRWKDADELAARTGHPDYWDAAGADEIRAEGSRLAALAEAGAFPFDGTWTDFRPDPKWPLPAHPPQNPAGTGRRPEVRPPRRSIQDQDHS
jgi:hypothetical protein